MIRKSVDVIRAAAKEQRGFASQVISPLKMRLKFEEAAADLEQAAERMERLEKALGLHLEFLSTLPAGWLGKTSGDVGLLNDAYLASSEVGFPAKAKRS